MKTTIKLVLNRLERPLFSVSNQFDDRDDNLTLLNRDDEKFLLSVFTNKKGNACKKAQIHLSKDELREMGKAINNWLK